MCTILEVGVCECKWEPRGDHGLEGYQLGGVYKYERVARKDAGEYYRVYPACGSYYETCGPGTFKKHFQRRTTI